MAAHYTLAKGRTKAERNNESRRIGRCVLLEFNDYEANWGGAGLAEDLALVHSLGRKATAMTHSNPVTATVENHLRLYRAGFDVAYTYNLANAVVARVDVNTERGLTPP